MSGVYYVYLKVHVKGQEGNWARFQLCFPSRYDADEFYRTLQVAQLVNPSSYIEGLVRTSPQFWCYSNSNWHHLVNIQRNGLVNEFRERIITTLLNDGDGGTRGFTIIPNPVTGPDWLDGGCFFIRNRRQPDQYWFVHNNHLHTSESRRDKFCITVSKPATIRGHPQQRQPEGPLVLIREDSVTVSVVLETTASTTVTRDNKYISIENGRDCTSVLVVNHIPYVWKFGELMCRSIGVRWEDERDAYGRELPMPLLKPMTYGADEWELC
ncbi:hypothetical protein B0T17DRAFT_517809 [Bombardia bombarda]|uniref:Uncharacterized protein n=1 Tax=Bombardia bombarda TaxID=252184 RepID=A0AA39XL33_9PEZI|nr:hypothetical protein B0T17DRAFT_517809 [Bombardia bombarda]